MLSSFSRTARCAWQSASQSVPTLGPRTTPTSISQRALSSSSSSSSSSCNPSPLAYTLRNICRQSLVPRILTSASSATRSFAKEPGIEFDGTVTKKQRSFFEVELDNGSMVRAVVAGLLRKRRVRIAEGTYVTVEVSPYDLSQGRIVWVHREMSDQGDEALGGTKFHLKNFSKAESFLAQGRDKALNKTKKRRGGRKKNYSNDDDF